MVYIGGLEYDEQLKSSKKIIIFGAGSLLPWLMKKMDLLNLSEKIIAICDNNNVVQGTKMTGISVVSPEDVYSEYKDADYIVYNQYFMDICKELQKNNIIRIHLIRQGSL